MRTPKTWQPFEFLGNLILLIVGGNDTTRNSISGGVLALNQFPEEYDKLRPIPTSFRTWWPRSSAGRRRWRYMRRTANRRHEIGGKQIRKTIRC